MQTPRAKYRLTAEQRELLFEIHRWESGECPRIVTRAVIGPDSGTPTCSPYPAHRSVSPVPEYVLSAVLESRHPSIERDGLPTVILRRLRLIRRIVVSRPMYGTWQVGPRVLTVARGTMGGSIGAQAKVVACAWDDAPQTKKCYCYTDGQIPAYRLTRKAHSLVNKRQKPSGKRGRPPDTDPADDARIAKAWKSSGFPTYADLARELRQSELSVRQAVDRHRKREARKALK